MYLTRDLILMELYTNGIQRQNKLHLKLKTTISKQLKYLLNQKLIQKFKGTEYNAIAYDITNAGVKEVMKTTRIRILEELNANPNLTQTELKTTVGASVSPMMTRLRRDKEIQRHVNPNNRNDIVYTLTQKGYAYLKDYNLN